MFPNDAADIFDYIIHGRMTGIYGDNPYRNVPKDYSDDPFLPWVAWKKDPSPYGPLWEIMAGTVARLTGDDQLLTILAYKQIPGAFYFASLILIRQVTNTRRLV